MINSRIISVFTLLYHNDSIFYGSYANAMILSSTKLPLAYEDALIFLLATLMSLHAFMSILILSSNSQTRT